MIIKHFAFILSFILSTQCTLLMECFLDVKQSTVRSLTKTLIPELNFDKRKGDAGRIAVIGGSIEYTGAPYFSAITALKVGADLVYVITTETAAPVIKAYSPDLIVYPYLHYKYATEISKLLTKMDVIVIGPGLGRDKDTMDLFYEIIESCKALKKPLVIDADGIYGLALNTSILMDYPVPGVILTPNFREAEKLKIAVGVDDNEWYKYWGRYTSVLVKGKEDKFLTAVTSIKWSLSEAGSARRIGGQGDILAGALGIFYKWALDINFCDNENSVNWGQSVASYGAALLTRYCSSGAYAKHGRSMLASDVINEIHTSFKDLFENTCTVCSLKKN